MYKRENPKYKLLHTNLPRLFNQKLKYETENPNWKIYGWNILNIFPSNWFRKLNVEKRMKCISKCVVDIWFIDTSFSNLFSMLWNRWIDSQWSWKYFTLLIMFSLYQIFVKIWEEAKGGTDSLKASEVLWRSIWKMERSREGSGNPFIFISIRLSSLECYPLGTISVFHALHALYGDVFNRVPRVKWMMQVSRNRATAKQGGEGLSFKFIAFSNFLARFDFPIKIYWILLTAFNC